MGRGKDFDPIVFPGAEPGAASPADSTENEDS